MTRSEPAGDDLASVYTAQRDRLRRLAYLMTGRQEAAEDIVQDAFARVQKRWAAVESPAAYLQTVVVNLCMDWRRRAALERERTPRPASETVAPPEVDEMWERLSALPHDERVVVVLRYYEDLSVDAIAELVECPPGTVRSRIHRALSKLRQEMTP